MPRSPGTHAAGVLYSPQHRSCQSRGEHVSPDHASTSWARLVIDAPEIGGHQCSRSRSDLHQTELVKRKQSRHAVSVGYLTHGYPHLPDHRHIAC